MCDDLHLLWHCSVPLERCPGHLWHLQRHLVWGSEMWMYLVWVLLTLSCGLKSISFSFLTPVGSSTATYFTGGHIAVCYWTIYGPLLSIFFCFIFGCFHLYRVCCGVSPKRQETRTVRHRSNQMIVMTAQSEDSFDDISPYYWVPLGIIAIFMTIYMIVHASIYTAGYEISCRQYRQELVKYMQATGPMVQAIQGRLSCNAIFDFMDYIHPDVWVPIVTSCLC